MEATDLKQALEACRRNLDLKYGQYQGLITQAGALSLAGKEQEALAIYQRAHAILDEFQQYDGQFRGLLALNKSSK